ncbi:MAG: dTDP-4-dehydrorhamnose 3,5-epimerase family protein [Candidatus Aenigmarchaeota archaeon]|nr:dTDP-4-dehydrorhamnose 3,5-epimerase family protein [Candidatus Aenigmarchaeota archaeon]
MDSPKLISLEWKVDDRGYLMQLFNADLNVKRAYVVGNYAKGTIRGFHGHMKEWKYFCVVKGSVKFVLVQHNVSEGVEDPEPLREKIHTYVLSDRKPSILVIPPCYYNGWVSLEEGTLLMGMSDRTLAESIDDDYRIDPFTFGDVWSTKPR